MLRYKNNHIRYYLGTPAIPSSGGGGGNSTITSLVGITTLGQKTMSNSLPVVLASDQSSIPVTGTFFQATQPVSLASLPALATGSNIIGQVEITDGTNIAGVLKSDGTVASTQNAQIISGTGMTTTTVSLSSGTQNTSWYDMLNYSSVSVEILTNTTPATLTFQTSGDASETNIRSMPMQDSQNTLSAPSLTTTSAVGTFTGSRQGRYFRISSNLAGGNTATLVITFYTNQYSPMTFGATVQSNSATGSAVPSNAFYLGVNNGGNLGGLTAGGGLGDGGSATNTLAVTPNAYNGTNYDRIRTANGANNTIGTGLLGAGTMGFDGTNYQRITTNSTTYTSKNGLDINLLGTLGTAFTTAGKIDVKGADGDVFVRNATSANFLANVTLQTQTDTVMVGGVNIKEINAVTPLMGNGTTGTGSLRVTIASDNTAFSVNATLSAETTKVIGTVRVLGNGGATVDSTVGAGTAPTNQVVVGAIYNSTEISPTTSQAFALQADSKGRLRNVIMDAAGNTRGVNVTSSNAALVDLSSSTANSTAGLISVKIDQTTVGSTNAVTPVPASNSGWSFNYQSALSSTKQQIKGSAGTFGGFINLFNPNTATTYIQVFNKASASVTVGSTTPDFVITLPGIASASGTGSDRNLEITCGLAMNTGITIAATTTASGSSAPANAIVATFLFL